MNFLKKKTAFSGLQQPSTSGQHGMQRGVAAQQASEAQLRQVVHSPWNREALFILFVLHSDAFAATPARQQRHLTELAAALFGIIPLDGVASRLRSGSRPSTVTETGRWMLQSCSALWLWATSTSAYRWDVAQLTVFLQGCLLGSCFKPRPPDPSSCKLAVIQSAAAPAASGGDDGGGGEVVQQHHARMLPTPMLSVDTVSSCSGGGAHDSDTRQKGVVHDQL